MTTLVGRTALPSCQPDARATLKQARKHACNKSESASLGLIRPLADCCAPGVNHNRSDETVFRTLRRSRYSTTTGVKNAPKQARKTIIAPALWCAEDPGRLPQMVAP